MGVNLRRSAGKIALLTAVLAIGFVSAALAAPPGGYPPGANCQPNDTRPQCQPHGHGKTSGQATAADLAPFRGLSVNGSSASSGPPQVTSGSKILVQGMGWKVGSPVQIIAHSTPVLLDTATAEDLASIPAFSSLPNLATATADGVGGISLYVQIPDGLELGSHSIDATGVDPLGNPLTLSIPFTLVAAGATSHPSSALGFTGLAAVGMVLAALALIALGSLLLVSVRRRSSGRTAESRDPVPTT